jgi:hypothetical protein
MRRLGTIMALGTMLGLFGGTVTAAPALARGDGWQFAPAPPVTLPASFCGFRVRVTFPVNKEYTKLLKTSDGTVITLTTGALKASYTNLSTGKTITVSQSGPSKTTVHPDGSVVLAFKGHTGFALTRAASQRFGVPRVFVTAGAVTVSIDAAGNTTSATMHGHVLVDICAALS